MKLLFNTIMFSTIDVTSAIVIFYKYLMFYLVIYNDQIVSYTLLHVIRTLSQHWDCIRWSSGSALAWCAGRHGFDSRSGDTKDFKNGTWCFPAKCSAFER